MDLSSSTSPSYDPDSRDNAFEGQLRRSHKLELAVTVDRRVASSGWRNLEDSTGDSTVRAFRGISDKATHGTHVVCAARPPS